MPLLDPPLSLSSRQEAFRNHYYEKTRVSMSFHDTPQQPARPAGVVPDGAKQPAPGCPRESGGPDPVDPGPQAARPRNGYGLERPPGKRAEGAETDRLYQRRNDYAELHDLRSPETIERRQQDSLKRLERAGPFNPPGNAGFAPDHDIS